MSDAQESDTAAPVTELTSKDIDHVLAAIVSVKGGVPDLDMDLYMKNGNFKAKKTALNSWTLLKKKLYPRPKEGEDGVTAPVTPKKTPAKKRTKTQLDEGNDLDDEGEAVKKAKTPRKTAANNTKKVPDDGAVEGEASAGADAGASAPATKKPRGRPRGKKAAASKPAKEDSVAEQAAVADNNEHVDADGSADKEAQETSAPVAAVDENINMEGVVETTE